MAVLSITVTPVRTAASTRCRVAGLPRKDAVAHTAPRKKAGVAAPAWVQILALSLGSRVTAGKLPNLPEPPLPHL